ncbi:hypothetical protein [Pseudaquabacterium rugosum]|uniref:Cupin domain-containing protein n=1 Tax=Pseudaquabacterium rugosum TaxID=2984194 RepID=A0ABU9BFX7_9BURK
MHFKVDTALEQKFLLTGEDDSPNNYLLNVGRTGEGGWATPRHRHNFDQVRFVLKGNYPYGENKVLPEGWVAYFPESVHYGPQARPEGLEMMVCQFGGASGNGFLSVKRREAANDALKKRGEFKAGFFHYTDNAGQPQVQDGSEACFEQATGRRVGFASPRYDDLVVMNPANYAWLPTAEAGVSVKPLGSFTERNARLGFVRIEAEAIYSAGQEDSIQILFVAKGRLLVEGQELGPRSALEFCANEGPVGLTALEPVEIFYMVLPRF